MPSYPFSARIRNAWNAFVARDKQQELQNRNELEYTQGYSTSIQTARTRLHPGNERSIIASVYTRIAIDVAANAVRHVRVDTNNHFVGTVDSGLNECLTMEANIDQTGREFIFDAVMSMMDEGCVALVPVDTSENMINHNSFDIITMRVGKVLQWYPWAVQVEVYNERTGHKEQVTLPKDRVALIENPLYAVMNEPNSTLRRLVRKLNLLDAVDEQSASGKLDLIIQLPYTIKSKARQEQADLRRKQIEDQLEGTKYGIAYIDGTERITQLNRPAENNLMSQIEYLTSMLYGQLGMTQAIFDGTADETTMLNYYNRTIEPILSALCDELTRKFLTKTARSQGQRIAWFKDPFRLVTTTQIADMADRFTRNEVLSSNEVRAAIGYPPVDDPAADELRNKNLNPVDGMEYPSTQEYDPQSEFDQVGYELDQYETDSQNGI